MIRQVGDYLVFENPPLLCKKCGQDIPRSSLYCPHCFGFPIPPPKVRPLKVNPDQGGFFGPDAAALDLKTSALPCKTCGKEIPNSALACPQCYGFQSSKKVQPPKAPKLNKRRNGS